MVAKPRHIFLRDRSLNYARKWLLPLPNQPTRPNSSVLPAKCPETLGREPRIANRVGDGLVAEVVLDRPCINPIIRQLETGGVSQHVGMDRKAKVRHLPKPRQHLSKARRCERGPTLGLEDEQIAPLLLPLQAAQGPDFLAVEDVGRGGAVLDTPDMDFAGIEIDLVPTQVAKLRRPQTMSERGHDHGRIPKTVTIALEGCLLQAADLGLGEIFTTPQLVVGDAVGASRNRPTYIGWSRGLRAGIRHMKPPFPRSTVPLME
jgi:hypothetical protein